MGPRVGTHRPITSDRRDLGGAGIATQLVRCPVAACCHSYCHGRRVAMLVILPTCLTSACFAHSRRRGWRGTSTAECSECFETCGTCFRSKMRADRTHDEICRNRGPTRLRARGLSRALPRPRTLVAEHSQCERHFQGGEHQTQRRPRV